MLNALELKVDHSFRTGPFKRFIETENVRYYRSVKNVELIGGEMGHWLEILLPEDIDELKRDAQIGQQLQ